MWQWQSITKVPTGADVFQTQHFIIKILVIAPRKLVRPKVLWATDITWNWLFSNPAAMHPSIRSSQLIWYRKHKKVTEELQLLRICDCRAVNPSLAYFRLAGELAGISRITSTRRYSNWIRNIRRPLRGAVSGTRLLLLDWLQQHRRQLLGSHIWTSEVWRSDTYQLHLPCQEAFRLRLVDMVTTSPLGIALIVRHYGLYIIIYLYVTRKNVNTELRLIPWYR